MHRVCRLVKGKSFVVAIGLSGCLLCFSMRGGSAQDLGSDIHAEARLALSTQAVGPQRFLAVHGRRALISGYATGGLEMWGYPFQILSGYKVAFREAGTTTSILGEKILSLVTYEPASVTRVYLGPGFIVREKLFVPLDEAGVLITYSIESKHLIKIEVKATPVLNLMWPAAVGGQSVAWNPSLSAFVLSESTEGFTATVGSPDIVAHDDVSNRTVGGAGDAGLGFTLRPNQGGFAGVYVALNPPHSLDLGLLFRSLVRERQNFEAEADAHVQQLRRNMLRVTTPDAEVNHAIAWAQVALDQAWVCNADLGCGYVAGYGPSREGRRPQYDWFFAGDGLIATDAALSEGDNAHAREELAFILRHQNRATGMIWHEMSQSAGLLDWAGKYPYMFVHVDISFQFLNTLARYVDATGDVGFLRDHWSEIEATYHYCGSVIDARSGLPVIPADKEGGNEQDRMSDDLGLSASWVGAAAAFAQVSRLTGHDALAQEAAEASARARAAIPNRYWDAQQSRWINGHTLTGKNVGDFRSGPSEAIALHLFSREQTLRLLDQFASSSFLTDWGARGVSSASPAFDPESYSRGSVSALASASLAKVFWEEHRPVAALELWRSLLPWASLDSLGHMHEVLAGDFYRPQVESVPEQTWSSAGFLEATVDGLLGLRVNSILGLMSFAPHLPSEWRDISLEEIMLSGHPISLKLHRAVDELSLQIENSGGAVTFDFAPEIPLGATLRSGELNGRKIEVQINTHPEETDAQISFTVPHGKSEVRINWVGGVSLLVGAEAPLAGDPSSGVRVVESRLDKGELTVEADVPADRESHLRVQTGWKFSGAEGVSTSTLSPDILELTFAPNHKPLPTGSYRRVKAVLHRKD